MYVYIDNYSHLNVINIYSVHVHIYTYIYIYI